MFPVLPTAPSAPASHQPVAAQGMQTSLIALNASWSQLTPKAALPVQTAQQFGRFVQSGISEPAFAQKPFDAYNPPHQPSSGPSQFEGFPAQQQQLSQAPTQHLTQPQASQQAAGPFSSAPSEYSSYYTADQQNRAPYNFYNQTFGQQQTTQSHQEGAAGAAASQQRSYSGYQPPQSDNLSQYPQSSASRFTTSASATDAQNSGNTTPHPPAQGQQQGAPSAAQGQAHSQQPQQQQQQPHGNQYPYNHPYYTSPFYAAYMTQFQGGGGYGQAGYTGHYAKGGYGQHPYNMSPQAPFDHTSQASGFGQSSLHRGESGLASGPGEFGRAGAGGQSGSQQGIGASGFGTPAHEGYGRGSSSFQSQGGQGFNPQSAQAGAPPPGGDDLKPFGDSKVNAGPSPSLGGARPGSATNTNPSQSGLPPPQSNQQGGVGGTAGYGGYPSHVQGHGLHGNQSAAAGYGMGAGAGQTHGSNPYGAGYGGQAFGGNYYGGNQPRGWGGNYH